MAYIPPLNGGRLNASIGGNSTSAGAGYKLLSTGTMVLAGGNNITLSQNGSTITISGGAAGVNTLGMSNLGNTSGTSGTITGSAMQFAFAGGNNVTLSQSLNGSSGTITISAAAQSNQTMGFTAASNTTLTSTGTFDARSLQINGLGAASVGFSASSLVVSVPVQSAQTLGIIQGMIAGVNTLSAGSVNMSASNGITFGLNATVLTASHNGITSQTNQTQGFTAGTTGGANTLSTSTGTFDARSLYLNAYGNVSAGFSASSIFISATQSNQALSGSNGAFTFQTATFGSSNGMHFYSTNGSLVGSYTVPTVHNLTLAGNSTSAGAGYIQVSSGTLTLAGGNNITLSQNGNAVTISGGAGGGIALANSQTTYTSGTANLLEGGGAITIASTTGQKYNFSVPGTSSISATGALSVSTNGAIISMGVPAFSAGISSNSTVSNRLILAAGNNITLSQSTNASGATISITGGAAGGIAIANSQTTYSTGTANFLEGGGAITIASTTGQKYNFSVPATSSLSATGGVQISTNGSTISIGVPMATLSRWEYPENVFGPLSAASQQSSLSIQHVYVPFNVTGTAMKIAGSLAYATNTSVTTASNNYSLWMGIYTLNGSTLSLASSGSANNGFVVSQGAGSTSANTLSLLGIRQMTVPVNINMTPGEYWVAAVLGTASTYTGNTTGYIVYGNSALPTGAGLAAIAPIGGATSAARDALLFQGMYTTQTSAGPSSIVSNQINNTSAGYVMRAAFYHAIYNATY